MTKKITLSSGATVGIDPFQKITAFDVPAGGVLAAVIVEFKREQLTSSPSTFGSLFQVQARTYYEGDETGAGGKLETRQTVTFKALTVELDSYLSLAFHFPFHNAPPAVLTEAAGPTDNTGNVFNAVSFDDVNGYSVINWQHGSGVPDTVSTFQFTQTQANLATTVDQVTISGVGDFQLDNTDLFEYRGKAKLSIMAVGDTSVQHGYKPVTQTH